MGGLAGSEGESALSAIVGGALAWSTAPEIAGVMKCTIEYCITSLSELVGAGLVEAWDRGGSPAFTLTPLGAEKMGVRLVEVGLGMRLRWSGGAEPHVRRQARPEPVDDPFARAEDPGPGPAELAARADELERYLASQVALVDFEKVRLPAVILMGCSIPWTERRKAERSGGKCRKCRGAVAPGDWCEACGKGTCPACKGRRLPASHYCARCHRWGLDGRLRAQQKADQVAAERARNAG